jgi:hypothetical protein
LWAPAGKPYRDILTEWQASEEYCLAIGDRVNYDIPADCPRLVTVVINQNSFSLHAGIIVELISRMKSQGEDFFAAFHKLNKTRPGAEQARFRWDDGLEIALTWYKHPALPEARPVIILPG